jgi:hypothetical protein
VYSGGILVNCDVFVKNCDILCYMCASLELLFLSYYCDYIVVEIPVFCISFIFFSEIAYFRQSNVVEHLWCYQS